MKSAWEQFWTSILTKVFVFKTRLLYFVLVLWNQAAPPTFYSCSRLYYQYFICSNYEYNMLWLQCGDYSSIDCFHKLVRKHKRPFISSNRHKQRIHSNVLPKPRKSVLFSAISTSCLLFTVDIYWSNFTMPWGFFFFFFTRIESLNLKDQREIAPYLGWLKYFSRQQNVSFWFVPIRSWNKCLHQTTKHHYNLWCQLTAAPMTIDERVIVTQWSRDEISRVVGMLFCVEVHFYSL